jgi:hypothetical protein
MLSEEVIVSAIISSHNSVTEVFGDTAMGESREKISPPLKEGEKKERTGLLLGIRS